MFRWQLPSGCHVLLMLAIVGLSSLLTGCGNRGPDRGPTSEIVLKFIHDGKPVTGAQVNLSNPETGAAAGGELDPDGKVLIANIPPGTYTVTVIPPSITPVPGQPAPPAQSFDNIPEKYRQVETTPLKVEVKPEPSEDTFDLTN